MISEKTKTIIKAAVTISLIAIIIALSVLLANKHSSEKIQISNEGKGEGLRVGEPSSAVDLLFPADPRPSPPVIFTPVNETASVPDGG